MDMSLSKLQKRVKDRETCSPWGHKELDTAEQLIKCCLRATHLTTKVKWVHMGGVLLLEDQCPIGRERKRSLSLPCMDIARRQQPSKSQEESSDQNPNMLAPWSQTPSRQNFEKINLYCLSHLVCGILSWQSKLTKTTYHSQTFKMKDKERILKTARKKWHLTNNGKVI